MATATFKGTTITEKNVEQAIKEIKTVPEERRAYKHLVEFERKFFPVKYVFSETYKNATGGIVLDPNKDFDSTDAIKCLEELEFRCVEFKEYKRSKKELSPNKNFDIKITIEIR